MHWRYRCVVLLKREDRILELTIRWKDLAGFFQIDLTITVCVGRQKAVTGPSTKHKKKDVVNIKSNFIDRKYSQKISQDWVHY